MPVFNLICSYMLWKRRAYPLTPLSELGLTEVSDLSTELGRHRVVRCLIERAERENLTGRQRNEIARGLASGLGIDFTELSAKRILQLMNAEEVAEIAGNGVGIQLHRHRHCTPEDEVLFRREIDDNRQRIQSLTGKCATHFCYPSGIYRRDFFAWLAKDEVLSATTGDVGLVRRG